MAEIAKAAFSPPLGPNGDAAAALTERLCAIRWFAACGGQEGSANEAEASSRLKELVSNMGAAGFMFQQAAKDELQGLIQSVNVREHPLWEKLYQVPERIKSAAEQTGRTVLLSYALDDVPEKVFHPAFDGAFSQLEDQGEEVLQYAMITVMYVSGLATAWEIVADVLGESNPFLPIVEIFEQGKWPIGIQDNNIYLY